MIYIWGSLQGIIIFSFLLIHICCNNLIQFIYKCWQFYHPNTSQSICFCPSHCWSKPPSISHLDSDNGLQTGTILISSSLPYNPFSTQQLEASFKTHVPEHVTLLLNTIQRLPIKCNSACEVVPTSTAPSLWLCPHIAHAGLPFIPGLTSPLPTPDFAGIFFSQIFRCLDLLHPQASVQLPSPEATKPKQCRCNHHNQVIC